MRPITALFFVFTLISGSAFSAEYPQGPDQALTPGTLCDRPDTHRYPEKIPYCSRDVSRNQKKQIFAIYRSELGYVLDLTRRSDYKIDHYVPLCAGGSNDQTNLWPQHVSIFTITDPIEALGCEKLAMGKIRQKVLIDLIRRAKNDLKSASMVLEEIRNI